MNTEMGVVIYIYLKHSPDYVDSKYIWVHVSNSVDSNVSVEIPFFGIICLTQGEKEVWPGGTQPMLLPE